MTKEEVLNFILMMNIKDYIINDDLSVDVMGDVDLSHKKLKSIPIQFNTVTGSFDCSYNELKNLNNSPRAVGGAFSCAVNKISSLELGPKIVEGQYDCNYNKLKNLMGLPSKVEVLGIAHNPLTTFEGIGIHIKTLLIMHSLPLTEMDFIPKSCNIVLAEQGFEASSSDDMRFSYIEKRFLERAKIKEEQQLLNKALQHSTEARVTKI